MELWAVVALSGLLLTLSAAGSFLGVARAAVLFNAWPLVIFWFLFALLLIAGLWTFEQLRHRPGSLMMHLAALLILSGAMWGSTRGHEAAKLLGCEQKIPSGRLLIFKGEAENLVRNESGAALGRLPFSLGLSDFRVDYYPSSGPPTLEIGDRQGRQTISPAEVGRKFAVADPRVEVEITQSFATLMVGEKRQVFDAGGGPHNPALKLRLTWPDGQAEFRYVTSLFPEFGQRDDGLRLSYVCPEAMPQQFTSSVIVTGNNGLKVPGTISVNHPMHFGGYHFYQTSCGQDPETGTLYTVLSVVSDAGLLATFAGFILLILGTLWHCWARPAWAFFARRRTDGD
jgi:hypothetical protein